MIEQKLEDITLHITDGKHGDCESDDNSGFYFISCKDVYDGKIHYDGARQITEKDFVDTHKRTMLEPNDILITNSGTIGRMALVKDNPYIRKTTFQKSVAIIKPNPRKICPAYLYYCLLNLVNQFVNQSNGSAQKNLLLGTMRNFEIQYEKDFSKQDKIVGFIQTYDDLIENNQKQIKLLEEAAQRLYKEWFVDLRFPGYENTPIVDGVPHGWKKDTIDSKIELLSGYAFKSNDFCDDGKYKIITIKNVKDGQFDCDNVSRIAEIPSKMPKHCCLSDGDILLSLTGNVGRVCMAYGEDYLLNQRVAKLKSEMPAYAYCLFRSKDMFDEMNNLANGAAQQNLSPIRTGKILHSFPTDELIHKFEEIVFPMIKNIVTLNKSNNELAAARDCLLPKLMNGELEV